MSDEMKKVHNNFPESVDAATLYVDALMLAASVGFIYQNISA